MLDKILLFPYYLSLKIRDRHYSRPGRKVFVPSVPSICVGNVTVGGTGKTPHVEMILDILQKSERWSGSQLAVLSRGYKRESKGFQQVTLKSSASLVGDEPLQIKKNFPNVNEQLKGLHTCCNVIGFGALWGLSSFSTLAQCTLRGGMRPLDF